jgi:hypothetical protein
MTDPDRLADWLATALLAGEAGLGARIAEAPTPLPPAVAELLRIEAADPGLRLDLLSGAAREACDRAPREQAPLLAAAALLRLTWLGHEDPAWAGGAGGWLGSDTSDTAGGLLLLGLALHERSRVQAGEHADLVLGALDLLPADAPLVRAQLHHLALRLALNGMLHRLADRLDLPRPGDVEPEPDPALVAEVFYDAVACGRIAQARFLLARIDRDAEAFAWHRRLLDLHRGSLDLFAAVAEGGALPPAETVPAAPLVAALLAGDQDFLADCAPGQDDAVLPLLAYDGLRAALGCRDAATARRLLEERQSGPRGHYLDDLFLARLLLLEGREAAAHAALGRLADAATRFGAWSRVEVELRLACELQRTDLCRLGLGIPASPAAAAADPGEAVLAGPSAAAAELRDRLDRIGPFRRIVLAGPADGTTTAIGSVLHHRAGGGALVRIRAEGSPYDTLGEAPAAGTVVVEGLDGLAEGDLARWLDRLAAWESLPGLRIVVALAPGVLTAPAEGVRAVLAWNADDRIAIPAWSHRRLDAPVVVGRIMAGLGSTAVLAAPARATLARRAWDGGWPELSAWARTLARLAPAGVVGVDQLRQAARRLAVADGAP